MKKSNLFKILLFLLVAANHHCFAQLPSSKPMSAFYSKYTRMDLDKKKPSDPANATHRTPMLQSQKSLQDLTMPARKVNTPPVMHSNDKLSPEQKRKLLPSNTITLYKRKGSK
jgi:hypothetical protein